jgi:very-short-patch-repair endonuclease
MGWVLVIMKAKVSNLSTAKAHRRELRTNATLQEIILWSRLKNDQLGFKFRRQHSFGKYIADFYCPKLRLVIEIDGSQHLE